MASLSSSSSEPEPVPPLLPASMAERARRSLAHPAVCSFIGGGVAGALSRTVVSPLERLKILFQIQDKGKTEYKMSVGKALGKMWREEGFNGFMKGNGTNCVRIIPYAAIQYTAFVEWKRLFGVTDANITPVISLMCGALAGITSVSFTYPLDIVRTRLSIQSASFESLKTVKPPQLPGMWATLAIMYKTEGGVRALYRGIIPTISGVAPYVGTSFMTYGILRRFLTKPGEDGPRAGRKLIAGAVSGSIAQTCTYPFDVLRRRFQINTMAGMGYRYNSMWAAVVQILKDEGPRGFYKGLLPNLLKVGPSMAVQWLTFETVRDAVKKWGDE